MLVRPLKHPVDLPELIALLDRCELHDGRPALSEHKFASLTAERLSGDGFVAEDDGDLIGYVHFLESKRPRTYELEVAVHPAYRGRLEESLLLAAIERVGISGGERLVAWVYQAGGEQPFEELGFSLEKTLHQMRIPLPAPKPVNAGLDLRGFRVGDEAAMLYVNNRAFEGHLEAGNWGLQDLRVRQGYDWYDPDGIRMLWSDDDLVAFCWTKQHPGHLGEIYLIAVDPDLRGRGFGRTAALEGLCHLHLRGSTEGMLYVDETNDAALRLYQGLGFTKHHSDLAFGFQL
jgi:mycothiol synthase